MKAKAYRADWEQGRFKEKTSGEVNTSKESFKALEIHMKASLSILISLNIKERWTRRDYT